MLRRLKHLALSTLQHLGAFHVTSITNWRRQRLLILCYHGLALKDEDQWCPGLFIGRELFDARMRALAREHCSVLPLREGVDRLFQGNLPGKSVAITFDDGFHDFHALAFPILQKYSYPATVYQTTYYSEHRFPVFNLMLDYLFWRSGTATFDGRVVGIGQEFELADHGRAQTVDALVRFSFRQNYSAAEKDQMASFVARSLGIDYEELRRIRMLQLMTAEQLNQIAKAGVAVELHTHRHRTPLDEQLFLREIRDNREAIGRYTGEVASQFCYPSGVHQERFLPWLRSQGIVSATTCELGIAGPQSDRLLLPRLLDSTGISQVEFEGWLAGLSSWLPRPSSSHYIQTPEPYWEEDPAAGVKASSR
jgi:hypothetical protein